MFLKLHGFVFEDSEARFCSFTSWFHGYFTSPNFFSVLDDLLTSFLPNFATSCSPTVASSPLVLSPFPFKHSFYLPLTSPASLRTFLPLSLLSLTCCSSRLHLTVWPPGICSLLLCCLTSCLTCLTTFLSPYAVSACTPVLDLQSHVFNQTSLLYPLLLFLLSPCLLVCFLSGWQAKYLSLCFSCNYSSAWKLLTCLNPFLKALNPPVLASTTSSSAPPVCSKTLLSDHELFLFMVGPQ